MGEKGLRLAFIKKKFSIHGGAERYLQTLIGQIKEAGHEIHIFADTWTEEDGIIFHKVDILPFSSFLSNLTFNIDANSKLQTLNSKLKFDCVISFERTTCQDIYRAGEGCHAEWLDIRAKTAPFYKRLSFKINPLHISLLNLEKKLFHITKLVIANSKMVKEQIIRHYEVPEGRINIIYNGVDLMRFTPENKDKWRKDIRSSLNVSEDSRILLFVGSGFERKGLKTFIDAASDLFVLPTLYDPFSNATLEAMASGLPVITTKNNGAAELIENGSEGFAAQNLFNARELADKINRSLSNLEAMGENARKKAEAFPIGRAVKEFIEVISRVKK
ncbi:MAG: glycosyltransferase family 4 protein [Nitrospirae bacterium]|nr:glycosyltransferase family 4 protein [Nitrospirota bacterium]